MKTTMTQAEQKAKYAEGTVIEVSGQEVGLENGTFVLARSFPDQPNGEAYFQWYRLNTKGERVKAIKGNIRGHGFEWLEANAKIIRTVKGQAA